MSARFAVIGCALAFCTACVGPAENKVSFPPLGTTKQIDWLEAREARRADSATASVTQ